MVSIGIKPTIPETIRQYTLIKEALVAQIRLGRFGVFLVHPLAVKVTHPHRIKRFWIVDYTLIALVTIVAVSAFMVLFGLNQTTRR
ncbi:MAG: hypothetical protein GF344_20990 [Chitinivibrionales bacterium]|nr:hypothetical protein [Chitinivibrionales bacterium]MBD3359069.1 hypothetical protein [Chitinivibrionales bacterium]